MPVESQAVIGLYLALITSFQFISGLALIFMTTCVAALSPMTEWLKKTFQKVKAQKAKVERSERKVKTGPLTVISEAGEAEEEEDLGATLLRP